MVVAVVGKEAAKEAAKEEPKHVPTPESAARREVAAERHESEAQQVMKAAP